MAAKTEISSFKVQDLMADSDTLESGIDYLLQVNRNGSEVLIEEMQVALRGLQAHINTLWDLIPITMKPTAASAVVAQQTFDSPELLESILIHLGVKDVLAARQVGRVWRDGVNKIWSGEKIRNGQSSPRARIN